MPTNNPKITDVARHAGVSVTTVSMVINGKGRISSATIEKVHQSIETLGYQPNAAAATLRSSCSHLIGLILRDVTDPFYTQLTAGVSEALEEQGYMLFLTQCGQSQERFHQAQISLCRQGVAGLIVSAVNEQPAPLLQNKVPMVLAARSVHRSDVDFVGPDNTAAARLATTHLIEAGHRHIAYIGGRSNSLTRAERIGGYCGTLLQYGLPFKPEWIVEVPRVTHLAIDAVADLLRHHPKVTAILCHDPEIAFGAVHGVAQMGRRIGKDAYIDQQVALIGFDGMIDAEMISPALTFLQSPALEIGRLAARRLLARIQSPQHDCERHLIAPTVMAPSV